MTSAAPLAARRAGRHLYLPYSDEGELGSLVATFVHDGLEAGEKIGYVTGSDTRSVTGFLSRHGVDWGPAAASGQFVIISLREIDPGADGSRTAGLAERVHAFTQAALGDGYAALRLASQVSALTAADESLEQMHAREVLASELTATLPVTGVCLYDRRKYAEAYLAAAEREHDTVERGHDAVEDVRPLYRDDSATLTRDRGRPVIRVAEEIDCNNVVALREVLASVMAEAPGSVTLDVSALCFIDVAGLRVIAEAATMHPDRSVCLQNARPNLKRMLALTGWSVLPNLIVQPAGTEL